MTRGGKVKFGAQSFLESSPEMTDETREI